MTKITVRIFTLVLAVFLLLGSLSGCGGKGDGNDSSKSDMKMGDSSIELPELEITGDKVLYLCWDDPASLKTTSTWHYAINEKMKEAYGCELEFVQTTYENLPVKATQMVLSGNSPDLIFYKQQDNPLFILNDIVQPVDQYVDFKSPLWKDVKELNDQFRINGKLYLPVTGFGNNAYTYYWTQELENLGLESPRDLYKKGEWTYKKLEEYAVKLTKKSSTGEVEVYGTAFADYFRLSTGVDIVKNENGVYSNNLRDPKMADFMNYAQNLTYDLKVRSLNGDDSNLFLQGKVAIYLYEQWFKSSLQKQLKAGEIDWAPAPKWDDADKNYAAGRLSGAWVAKGAKNPGGAMAFLSIERLTRVDTATKKSMRERDTMLSGADQEDFDLAEEMEDTKKFTLILGEDASMGSAWGNTKRFELSNQTLNWQKPWATGVEEFYPLLDAGVKEINDKLADYKK